MDVFNSEPEIGRFVVRVFPTNVFQHPRGLVVLFQLRQHRRVIKGGSQIVGIQLDITFKLRGRSFELFLFVKFVSFHPRGGRNARFRAAGRLPEQERTDHRDAMPQFSHRSV